LGLFLVLCAFAAYAHTVEDIKIIKISAEDYLAVITLGTDTMRLINVGDTIGTIGRVVEITSGRIVIENRTQVGNEVVVIHMVGEDKKIERIRRTNDDKSVRVMPQKSDKPLKKR